MRTQSRLVAAALIVAAGIAVLIWAVRGVELPEVARLNTGLEFAPEDELRAPSLPIEVVRDARANREQAVTRPSNSSRDPERAPDPGESLANRSSVEGRITDPDGKGISGASIRFHEAVHQNGFWRAQRLVFELSSRADGSFTCEFERAAPKRRILMSASAEGYAAQETLVPVKRKRRILLRLPRLARLTGRVHAADDGSSVPGATISTGTHKVTSALDGTFSLELPLDVPATLLAWSDGFLPSTETITLGESESTEHDIVLTRGHPLDVTVVDADTGEPVAGAIVRAKGRDEPIASSNARGIITLYVADRDISFTIEAPGYALFAMSWSNLDAASLPPPTIPLEPVATVVGRVLDGDDQPVGRASIRADCEVRRGLTAEEKAEFQIPGNAHHGLSENRTATNAEGNFELSVLPSATPFELTAKHKALGRSAPKALTVPVAAVVGPVELRIVAGATIRGSVSRNGAAWHNASVTAWSNGSYRVTNAQRGSYELVGLPPGLVRLALAGPYSGQRLDEVSLTVRSGQVVEHDFEVFEEVATIEGTVRYEAGAPLGNVQVSTYLNENHSPRPFVTKADEAGYYVLEVLAGHSYNVVATHDRSQVRRDDITAGSRGVDFEFARYGRLLLKLVDAEQERPIGDLGAGSVLWRPRGDTHFRAATSPDLAGRPVKPRVSVDGILELLLPLGAVDIHIGLNELGYVPQTQLGLLVEPEPNGPIHIALVRGVDVTVKLSGQGPEEPCVFLFLEEREVPAVRYAPGGAVRIGRVELASDLLELSDRRCLEVGTFRGLEPGRYTVRAFPDLAKVEPQWVEVAAGTSQATVQFTVKEKQ